MKLNKEQVVWISVLVLLMFLTIKISMFTATVKERFVQQVQDLFTMQEQWYRDLFNSVFKPFDWNLYILGQDDESESMLQAWRTDPESYGIFVCLEEKLECKDLIAPFLIAKYPGRVFKDQKRRCVIVVDKTKLNRPDLVFFMNAITPVLHRGLADRETALPPSNPKILVKMERLVGQEIELSVDGVGLASHYFLTIQAGQFPRQWNMYGVTRNGVKELINHFNYNDWRSLGQRIRFECFSGVSYVKFLFEFDVHLDGARIDLYGSGK
jgi:hypothetical protein